jgi:phage shock protein PspC (stress-responsive transcriptional regulator)
MQRIIQINIAGRIIPIEDDAYMLIKDYINALEQQFVNEEGNDEIIQDIESRISELFFIRLQSGAPAIDRSDVQKVIDTLGPASELNDVKTNYGGRTARMPIPYAPPANKQQQQNAGGQYTYTHDRLYRNPYDKLIGGVCSGIANYFDVDPVLIRLIFVVLLFVFGTGILTYIIAWIVIPVAKTPEELQYMQGGNPNPKNFHDITKSMADELNDLKHRGEQMSRELKDFFSKKK